MTASDREFLLRSLDDLERERAAGDLTAVDYADLKARYEAKLNASVSAGRPDRETSGHGSVWRVVATVVVVAVVGVGGGLAVARWSGTREAGEQVSGFAPPSSQGQLTEAARLFQEGDASGAIDIYQEMLDENPEDVHALTYMGWTLRNVGVQQDEPRLLDAGTGFIEEALEVDPDFSEAWFFRGIIYLRDEDDPEKAVEALRLALASDPIAEIEAAARELLAEIAQSS